MRDVTTADTTWWEIDRQIMASLDDGPKSTAELARHLALTDAGVTSLLLMLAAEGKIRVASVELARTV